eukprot:1828427-Lingulodinium_polyedra.AAC.1
MASGMDHETALESLAAGQGRDQAKYSSTSSSVVSAFLRLMRSAAEPPLAAAEALLSTCTKMPLACNTWVVHS